MSTETVLGKRKVDQCWFNVTDAAEYLGCSKKTVYQYISEDRLEPHTRGSSRMYFSRTDLDALNEPMSLTVTERK